MLSQVNNIYYTPLVVAAIAAAVLASLTSIPIAFAGGLGLGVLQQILSIYLPTNSVLATSVAANNAVRIRWWRTRRTSASPQTDDSTSATSASTRLPGNRPRNIDLIAFARLAGAGAEQRVEVAYPDADPAGA